MHTETDYLKSIAEEIIDIQPTGTTKPNNHLQVEAKRLERAIIHSLNTIGNFTQRDTFHFNTLSKLVDICDMLYEQAGTLDPNVCILIDMLAAIKQIVPSEIRPNLKLAEAFVYSQKERFIQLWESQKNTFREHEIEPQLIDIAAIPFMRFIKGKQKLCWGDYTWLKGYQAKLEIMDWDNADCNSRSEALISLLIGRNFNDDRFYIYCKKYIIERTRSITGKRNRVLAYAQCEKLVLEDTQVGIVAFDVRANSLSDRLIKWIREEIDFVETHERERPQTKFEFKWNIETLAFFFKLLWDHKVFGKIPLERFSEHIAGNCSSVGRDEFQPGTIFSRLYTKEPEVIKTVEKLLAEMLADVRQYLH
jgi:hypothetical protein